MKPHSILSKKILVAAATGLFILSACMQDPDAKAGPGQGKSQSLSAMTALASARSAAGDTVATAQLAKLRALAESGKTSGPEFDAALEEIRVALSEKDVFLIGEGKRIEIEGDVSTFDETVRADLAGLRILVESGETGDVVDSACARLRESTGGRDVVVIGVAIREDGSTEGGSSKGGDLIVIGDSKRDVTLTDPQDDGGTRTE